MIGSDCEAIIAGYEHNLKMTEVMEELVQRRRKSEVVAELLAGMVYLPVDRMVDGKYVFAECVTFRHRRLTTNAIYSDMSVEALILDRPTWWHGCAGVFICSCPPASRFKPSWLATVETYSPVLAGP